ncbi:DUF4625 domain-containing protein [Labilibaculum sp. A4]|uniref:DUF4625 domain-containing protein n=1 Tax=Labilibaculum euxinus TaxID=2686357 RepID=UPI000F61D681|nr:DUF4625 domain-containing protein [Labilibaculum euxinus]MDQ1772995.1 DUF4625 domain-containing protein [Labilibaculum euxinus]MWN78467.1 DUF4625 domain-containing protein [Labilibaculum euxinus]
MNTKIKSIAFILAVMGIVFFSSCDNNDDETVQKPVVSNLELGIGDSHIGYIGADLHIEAEIVAEGKIDKITVEIHQEEGSTDEIVVEYDEFAGLKNTTFHKHVDIPATTFAGTYHCHITVTDMDGNSTTVEEEVSIESMVDDKAPVITISSSPENGKNFANGETISISGSITDNISLAGLVVALVYETDKIADADVSGAANTKVIVMLHTHDFEDPDESDFSATIEVGAANDNNMTPVAIQGDNAWKSGNYYILVKSKDAMGNWAFSNHYPIVINL